jgi:molecular chaperone GrpE
MVEATTPPDPAEPAGSQEADAERERVVEPSEDGDPSEEERSSEPGPETEPPPEKEPEPGPEEEPLARAERERDEYLELARRAQADFENYRKRAAKEMATAGARAKAALVRELLPVVDNLERALASAREDEDGGLAEGVRLVHSELVGALERTGVESFAPEGEQFDPTVHEALSTRERDGAEPGVVLEVVEKGYRLDETVLRPARVVVSD